MTDTVRSVLQGAFPTMAFPAAGNARHESEIAVTDATLAAVRRVWPEAKTGDTLIVGSTPLDVNAPLTGYATNVLATPGLVSLWRLADTSGTSAVDAKGQNTGTYIGSPLLGQPGVTTDGAPAVAFNGSGAYMQVPYAAGLNTPQWSIEAWAKVTGGQGSYRALISNRDAGGSQGFGWVLYATDANVWQIWVNNNKDFWTTRLGSAPVAVDAWTHLAATFDGAKVRLYANGAESGTGATVTGFAANPQRPLRLAAGTNETTPGFFAPAVVSHAAAYNVALPAATVTEHASSR